MLPNGPECWKHTYVRANCLMWLSVFCDGAGAGVEVASYLICVNIERVEFLSIGRAVCDEFVFEILTRMRIILL